MGEANPTLEQLEAAGLLEQDQDIAAGPGSPEGADGDPTEVGDGGTDLVLSTNGLSR